MQIVNSPRKDGNDAFIVRKNQNVPLTDGRPLPPSLSWLTRSTDLTRTLPDWFVKRNRNR